MLTSKQLIQDWQATGITPKELQNATDRMLGSRKIAMDDVDKLGQTLLNHILKGENAVHELKQFEHIVKQLSVEFVNETLHKYIDTSAFAEIIVGPV